MEPYLFLSAVLGVLAVTMLLPSLRVWRRTGIWPFVFSREADPFQRLMGVATSTSISGVLLWAILFALFGPERLGVISLPVSVTIAGWMAVLLGALIVVVSQVQMGDSWRIGIDDRPTELVTKGLFGVVRNPIFSGLLLAFIGFLLITPASWTVMGFLTICILLELQTRLEEQHLLRLHGESYRVYAGRVGRFVPMFGKLHAPLTNAPGATASSRGGVR